MRARTFLSAAAAAVVAGGAAFGAAEAATEVRVGYGGTETHPFHIWSAKFEEEAERLSDGELDVVVYPNSQLGKEREMTEALLLGTLEIAVVGTGTILPNWVPEIGGRRRTGAPRGHGSPARPSAGA